MRLQPCPVCNRQLSTQASACPSCGHPLRPASRGSDWVKATGILGAAWAAPWLARLFFAFLVVVAVLVYLLLH